MCKFDAYRCRGVILNATTHHIKGKGRLRVGSLAIIPSCSARRRALYPAPCKARTTAGAAVHRRDV